LYSHPSLGTKTQLIAHLAVIVNLKQVLKTQVDDSPGETYQGRLGYLEHLKVTFDAYVEFAFDEWDYHRTQVLLDYLRAYEEYSSYLLVATNYHKGTINTWRPSTMPDIVNIPNLYGFAPFTRTLERMVHYKLGQPQFFDHEQKLATSWRLVRNNPVGSTTWHPKDDNLAGTDDHYGGNSYYGTIDRTDWKWGIPFHKPRAADEGMMAYDTPDEMFISNGNMTEWIYFKRSSITFGLDRRELTVLASNTFNYLHEVSYYTSTYMPPNGSRWSRQI